MMEYKRHFEWKGAAEEGMQQTRVRVKVANITSCPYLTISKIFEFFFRYRRHANM
jgi:hypothetical protein